MAKLTLADVTNIGGNPTSAANVINNNNDLVEQALENTLSRNGSTPNQMLVDLDMNGNDLINVGNVDADDITIDGTSLATQVDAAAQSAQDASNSAIAAQGSASDASISASAALDAQIAAEAAQAVVEDALDDVLYTTDIGVTVQAWNAGLDTISAFSYTLFDEVDAPAWRSALGLGATSTPVFNSVSLASNGPVYSLSESDTLTNARLLISGGFSYLQVGAAGAGDTTSSGDLRFSGTNLTNIGGFTVRSGNNWRSIYHQNNILGTVSQSGGIPTGAIVERGSNGSGQYIRFADGTQMCWLSVTDTSGSTTAEGNLFRGADLSWIFPMAFIDTATVVTAQMMRSANIGGITLRAAPTTTAISFCFWTAVSLASPASLNARLMAIGRWF